MLFTEILTCYKYREGTGHLSDEPTPIYIWLPWTAGFLALGGFYIYLRLKPDHTIKYPGYGAAAVMPQNLTETLAGKVAA